MTLDEFMSEWLATIVVRPRTASDYRLCARRVSEVLGDRELEDITRRDIDRLIGALSQRLAPATVHKTVTVLRQILRVAVEWGCLAESPAEGRLRLPRSPRKEVRPLEADDIARLLDAMPKHYRPAVLTAATSGLRRSELFGLTWDDLDLVAGTLRVRHQLFGRKLVEPKTRAAQRTVHLPRSTVSTLRAHRDSCPATELDLVFPTPTGTPVHPSNFARRVWRPAVVRAGLSGYTPHDLRHTYASALIRQGRSVKYVQIALGHESVTTTLDVYGHLFADEGEEAAAGIEAWLRGE